MAERTDEGMSKTPTGQQPNEGKQSMQQAEDL